MSAAGVDARLPAATLVPSEFRERLERHEARSFAKVLGSLASYVQAALFENADVILLESAFDDLLDDEEFSARVDAVVQMISVSTIQETLAVYDANDVPPPLLRLFSHSRALTTRAREAWALSNAMMGVYFQLLTKSAGRSSRSLPLPARTSDALAAPIPTFQKRALLNARKADAASWALLAATRRHTVDTRITEFLLQTWFGSLQGYLQGVISLVDIPLPEDVRYLVPDGPPIDVKAEIHAARVREVRHQESLKVAREQDADVYPHIPSDPEAEDLSD